MIQGSLKSLKNYKGIDSNLDFAISYLEENDIKNLPLGITHIKGDDVYINVMELDTKDESQVDYEIHKNHFDIFIPLAGTEKVLIGNPDYSNPSEYNSESDTFFADTETVSTNIITESQFILCFTGDPHKPGLAIEKPSKLKKAVVKVLQSPR